MFRCFDKHNCLLLIFANLFNHHDITEILLKVTLNTITYLFILLLLISCFPNSILSSDVNRFIMKNNKNTFVWFWDNFILIFHWKVFITILYLCTQHERQNNKMRKFVQFLLITLHLIKEHSHNYTGMLSEDKNLTLTT